MSALAVATWGLTISELLLFLFGAVLVLGLIGEYHREDVTAKKWLRIFELMVIVGVAGELLADGEIFIFSARLQKIEESRIAQLDQELIAAQKELAKRARRTSFIGEKQRPDFLAKLKPFAGQKFEVRYCKIFETDEIFGVAALLAVTLDNEAGWKRDPRSPYPINCSGWGLLIETSRNANDKTKQAAKALDKALLETSMPGVFESVIELSNGPVTAADGVVVTVLNHP